MTHRLHRLNLLIAHAAQRPWATGLARWVSPFPVDLHWSRTDTEVIGLAASGGMHVAVVDDDLPDTGGLDVLRRIRRLGLDLPCLLVCDRPDQRILRDALELDVFSVVEAQGDVNLLAPMILKLVRQVYRIDWRATGGMN